MIHRFPIKQPIGDTGFYPAVFRDTFSGNCVFSTETDNVKIGTDNLISERFYRTGSEVSYAINKK